ncbi:alanyl-tRNA editing protein [uncultured Roseobacter sp.]|uniref:alanyl-tRNA editing protein n=1 Tax=uncultured Roseobacter sp. TaxID=114847 RepID=UPI002630B702|nr:alanyl-tRNA editing protein [uncultured Roseobacter sp.]
MTRMLFRDDPYLKEASATVTCHTDQGGIVTDACIFYPTGGGQPGDSGWLDWDGGSCAVATTVKVEGGKIVLVPDDPGRLPPVGATVNMRLDWDRRYGHMRIHTALHLLSVAIPFGVTGGSVGTDKGRLDFDMAEPLTDKDATAAAINAMIATDAPVTEDWITGEELDAQPDLVKTLTVQPPRGSGRIRLIRIGEASAPTDLQPCGGTHVARLGEIGRVRLGKSEKKGRMNRRVYLHLDS